MAAKPKTVRQEWAEVVPEVFNKEWLLEQARLASELQRGYRTDFACPKCGYRKIVEVQGPDVAERLKQASALLEQTEGKPGTIDGETGSVEIIVNRTWPDAEDRDRDELPAAPETDGVSPQPGEG